MIKKGLKLQKFNLQHNSRMFQVVSTGAVQVTVRDCVIVCTFYVVTLLCLVCFHFSLLVVISYLLTIASISQTICANLRQYLFCDLFFLLLFLSFFSNPSSRLCFNNNAIVCCHVIINKFFSTLINTNYWALCDQ